MQAAAAQDTLVRTPPLVWPAFPEHYVVLSLPEGRALPLSAVWHAHAFVRDTAPERGPFRWYSSDTTTLRIVPKEGTDSAVLLVPRRPGRVLVRVASGRLTASHIVYVGTLPQVRRIRLLPRKVRVVVGGDVRLLVDPLDAARQRLPALWTQWTWSDSTRVEFNGRPSDAEMIFRATRPGPVRILATLDGRTAIADIEVVP